MPRGGRAKGSKNRKSSELLGRMREICDRHYRHQIGNEPMLAMELEFALRGGPGKLVKSDMIREMAEMTPQRLLDQATSDRRMMELYWEIMDNVRAELEDTNMRIYDHLPNVIVRAVGQAVRGEMSEPLSEASWNKILDTARDWVKEHCNVAGEARVDQLTKTGREPDGLADQDDETDDIDLDALFDMIDAVVPEGIEGPVRQRQQYLKARGLLPAAAPAAVNSTTASAARERARSRRNYARHLENL